MSYEMASYFMTAVAVVFIIINIINERYWKMEVKELRNKNEKLRNQLSERYNDGYDDAMADASLGYGKEYELPEFMKTKAQ